MKKILLVWVIAAMIAGCGGIPKGVTPVADFDIGRYQGVWYEIARLEHSFERGLNDVTASYGLRDDGGIDEQMVQPAATSSDHHQVRGPARRGGSGCRRARLCRG